MADIDTHTLTWQAVEVWLNERRQQCIESLINGTQADDKLRGEIRVIDDLLTDASDESPPDITPFTDY